MTDFKTLTIRQVGTKNCSKDTPTTKELFCRLAKSIGQSLSEKGLTQLVDMIEKLLQAHKTALQMRKDKTAEKSDRKTPKLDYKDLPEHAKKLLGKLNEEVGNNPDDPRLTMWCGEDALTLKLTQLTDTSPKELTPEQAALKMAEDEEWKTFLSERESLDTQSEDYFHELDSLVSNLSPTVFERWSKRETLRNKRPARKSQTDEKQPGKKARTDEKPRTDESE